MYLKEWLKLNNGAESRNRTDTGLPPPDFESGASTNFTTPALKAKLYPSKIKD